MPTNKFDIKKIETSIPKQDKQVGTPPKLIDDLIYKITNSRSLDMKRVTMGIDNETYIIKTKSKQELVVRLSINPNCRHKEEKWALEQCLLSGIPVPNVISIDKIKTNDKESSVSVESKLPGVTLEEKSVSLSDSKKAKLLNKVGAILSKVHSIPVNGFGRFDENGKGPFKSIKELLKNTSIGKERLVKIAEEVSLDKNVALRALEIIEKGTLTYPSVKPKLLHNDFGPKDVLVENDKITGLIDFERAEGGDPILDLARWNYFYNNSFNVDEIMKGYTNKSIFSEDFDKRFNLWRVYVGLHNLNWTFGKKNKNGIDFSKQQLVNDVNYYNKYLDSKQ